MAVKPADAAAFDAEMTALVQPFAEDGRLRHAAPKHNHLGQAQANQS